MSNSYKEYASKEYVHSVVISKENIEQIVTGFLAEAKAYASQVSEEHNVATDSHNDIRELIIGLTTRLNTLADSDDTTLDQLSEIIAFIKSNKDLISAITTDKVSIEDIVDNLTTNATNKPLSAAQGMQLKRLVDAKVDKIEGKGLSSNDYTGTEKTKLAGIQEGAVRSWNDLADKPFGEIEEEYTEEVTELATVEWDGVIGDKEFIVLNESATYVHVSDAIIPSLEGAGDVTLGAMVEGAFQEMAVPSNAMMADDGVILVNQFAISVDEDNKQYTGGIGNPFAGIVFPKKGLYFLYAQGGTQYISKLTCVFTQSLSSTRTVVKKIDEKYLPDTVATKADIQFYIDNAILNGAW